MRMLAWRSCCALCLTTLVVSIGCQDAPPPQSFHDVNVSLTAGILSHDLNLTNKNVKRLNRVDLTLTIYNETEVKTLERHWAEWGTSEMKVVNFPATGGPVQRLTLSGTATLGAEQTPVTIHEEYLWTRKPSP